MQMENVRVRNFFLSAWETDCEIIAQAISGLSKLRFLEFASNKELKMVEMVVSFQDLVYTKTIYNCLEQLGAGSIDIFTFGSDWLTSSVSALLHIHKRSVGWIHGSIGEMHHMLNAKMTQDICNNCGQRLLNKIQTRRYSEKKSKAQPAEEWDVVKKQKAIQNAADHDPDESPAALSDFLDFSASVSNALLEIDEREQKMVKEEQVWGHSNPQITIGFVYVAWNPCFPDLVKIGATKRDSPYLRIKELSGTSVPVKFELVASVTTSDPFGLEKRMKAHFQSRRVLKDGRYTEFFVISREVASDYCIQLSRTMGSC